jgi:hypothetical protein
MTPNRDDKRIVPGNGGYRIEVTEDVGPPDYLMPMPPPKSRGPFIPAGTGEGEANRPGPGDIIRRRRPKVPLIPTKDEIEKLPPLARAAFRDRCLQRMAPTFTDAATLETAELAARVAHFLCDAATIDTPLTAQLRCIRRDFHQLKVFARLHSVVADAVIPPEVFGPLWPPGIAPDWATKTA